MGGERPEERGEECCGGKRQSEATFVPPRSTCHVDPRCEELGHGRPHRVVEEGLRQGLLVLRDDFVGIGAHDLMLAGLEAAPSTMMSLSLAKSSEV